MNFTKVGLTCPPPFQINEGGGIKRGGHIFSTKKVNKEYFYGRFTSLPD